MTRDIAKLFAGLLLLLLVSGCASTMSVTTRFVPGPDLDRTRPIKVFKIDEKAPDDYEILGVVTTLVETGMNRASYMEQDRLNALQEDAAAMGADAIVGYYINKTRITPVTYSYWSSGLAARVRRDGQNPVNPPIVYRVVLPKGITGKVVDNKEDAEFMDAAARTIAQGVLARHGFYAIQIEESTPDPVLESFQAMDDARLSKYGGPETDYVLATKFLSKSYTTVVLATSESVGIESTLYSKSQRKAILQGAGAGRFTTGFITSIGSALGGNLRLEDAIRYAVFESLKGVPKISTNSGRE